MEKPHQSEEQVSILFADISGFTKLRGSEVRSFIDVTLRRLASKIDEHHPRIFNTWGDALFLVFHTAREAADCALVLRDIILHTDWSELGISSPLRMRIALHNAYAIITDDPVTKRPNAYGIHINQTARLEPITIPNEVFATESFKNALDVFPESRKFYAFDSVGRVPLAKDWGDSVVFRLRRPKEMSASVEELLEAQSTSPTVGGVMPNATALLRGNEAASRVVSEVLAHLDNFMLSDGVVRRNWVAHARYNLSRLLPEGVIEENIQWNYELENLKDEPVEHVLRMISAPELASTRASMSYHVVNTDGTESPLLTGERLVKGHLLETKEVTITLKQGTLLKVELRYPQVWPASKERPWIHNTFAPRQICFGNRLIFQGPIDDISVLCHDGDLEPAHEEHTPEDYYIYNIPSPILREQAVEYLLKFRMPLS